MHTCKNSRTEWKWAAGSGTGPVATATHLLSPIDLCLKYIKPNSDVKLVGKEDCIRLHRLQISHLGGLNVVKMNS